MIFDLEETGRVKLNKDILRVRDLNEDSVLVSFISDKGEGETVIDLGTFKKSGFKRLGKAI